MRDGREGLVDGQGARSGGLWGDAWATAGLGGWTVVTVLIVHIIYGVKV